MNPQDHKIFFLLDAITPHAIKTWVKCHQKIVDYTAQHYAFFASRRSQVMEELKQSLLDEQKEFSLDKTWKRIISQQFSNAPLSTTGSVLYFPGGRFNIGKMDTERFPQFPALYLAEDTETAYLESMGIARSEKIEGLSAMELTVAGNFSHFNILGKLIRVLDLLNKDTLFKFYEIIKDIQLPIYFRREANQLGINPCLPVSSLNQLYETITTENWRFAPMQLDTPANSQIIGQIARSAGLEAILYASAKNNHRSLCIFPENFENSDAYLEIVGNVADTVIGTRLDRDTYRNFLPTKWD